MAMMQGRRQSDNEANATFSNSFSIGFDGYMFILEFGMTDYTGTSRVHSRIVINPDDAEELNGLLAESVSERMTRFGLLRKRLIRH